MTNENNINNKKTLSPDKSEELLKTLKARFEKNMDRHKGIEWPEVQAKLQANTEKLWSLNEMEVTGGEPDVVGLDKNTGEHIFYDCSAESPKGAGVFVMTVKRWNQGKNLNLKITQLIWLLTWELRF